MNSWFGLSGVQKAVIAGIGIAALVIAAIFAHKHFNAGKKKAQKTTPVR